MKTKTFWVTRDKVADEYEAYLKEPIYHKDIGHGSWKGIDGKFATIEFCLDEFTAATGLSFRGGPKGIRKVRLVVVK